MNFSVSMRVFIPNIISQLMLQNWAQKLNSRFSPMTISRLASNFESAPHAESSLPRDSRANRDRRAKRSELMNASTVDGAVSDNLKEIAASTKVLSASEWQSLKQRAVSDWSIAEKNFENRMMVACCVCGNYSLGRSLMTFVGHANVVILAKYLRLCADSRDECGEDDILSVYAELRKRHSVFDVTTVVDIVHGLCATSRWKDSLMHVDTIRLTCSSVPKTILEDLAMAAFRNGEFDHGWELLHQIDADRMSSVSDDVFLTWMRLTSMDHAMMERLFAYLRDRDVLVSRVVAQEIKSWFERRTDEEWRASFTHVDNEGICLHCGGQLEGVLLSKADFEDLRSNFMMRVIRGDDVYLKTNPHELEKFQRFVTRTSPYTIVVDGLNIAFAQCRANMSAARFAEQLLRTVTQLDCEHPQRNARKILILGRHHMGKWPRATMKQIEEMAHVFFIDNLSKDDPFMLYAAMYSGQGTYFVSADLMRDHLFSLSDARLKGLFRRWQTGHQLHILNPKSLSPYKFKAPTRYRVAVQGSVSPSGVVWHIPYQDGSTRLPQEIPNVWMCIGQAPNSTTALTHKSLLGIRLAKSRKADGLKTTP